jgi:hypothetical protein
MDNDQIDKQVLRRSTMIYVPIALGAALTFLFASTVFGSYPLVAKIGGTVWVGLLSLIVSMPIITSRVKHQFQNQQLR